MPARDQLIGFFSYKGGVGRTAILCNTALALMHRLFVETEAAHGVFCVDLDVTAPGILSIFDIHLNATDIFQRVLSGAEKKRSLRQDSQQIRIPPNNREIPLFVFAQEGPNTDAIQYITQVISGQGDIRVLLDGLAYLKTRGRKDFFAPYTFVDLGSGLGQLPLAVFSVLDQVVIVGRGDRQHRKALPTLLDAVNNAFLDDGALPTVHVVLNQLPADWCVPRSSGRDIFLNDSGITSFIKNKGAQKRTLQMAPLVEAALTNETIFFPVDWSYTDTSFSNSPVFRMPVNDNEKSFRECNEMLARRIRSGGNE